MSNYQQQYKAQKQETLSLLEATLTIAQQQKQQKFVEKLKDIKERLIEGKLIVVVCGEFKEGKSSLMNALLNEVNDDLFPVDSDIATGIVSTITYGKEERIRVIIGDPDNREDKKIQRSQINDYVNEQKNKGKEAKMLMIQAPNPQLKEGLELVDTPGVGGLYTEHTGITYSFIPEADAILFVSDVKVPLSTDEIKFLQEITKRCSNIIPNMIFVATKIDANPNYKPLIDGNRQKLAQVLNISASEIPIVPVSSKLKLSYLKTQDEEDLEDSNFQVLENQLWQLLNSRGGYTIIARALGELIPIINEIRIPLQAQLTTCQQQNQQEIKNLEQQFQTEQKRLVELQSKNADWQKKLARGIEDINHEINNLLQKGFVKIEGWADGYLADESSVEDLPGVANLVQRDIDNLVLSLRSQLSAKAADLHYQIQTESGLNLNFYDIESLKYEKASLSQTSIDIPKTVGLEKVSKAANAGRFNIPIGSMIGGFLGGVAGFVLGGVNTVLGATVGAHLGSAIGRGAGFLFGAKKGLEQVTKLDLAAAKPQARKIIQQFIQESKQNCNHSLIQAIKELKRGMEDELNAQIKQLKETCDRTVRSIQDTRKLSDQQKAEKIKQVTIPLQSLQQVYQRTEALSEVLAKQQQSVATTAPSIDNEDWVDG